MLMLLPLTVVACGANHAANLPSAPTAGSQAISPATPATFTATGHVFENRNGIKTPMVDVNVHLWGVPCQGNPNCITWYSTAFGRDIMSDAEGRYDAPGISSLSRVEVMAGKGGYAQPCRAFASSQHQSADIELVPLGSLNTTNPPALMTDRPLVTGSVVEMTAAGPVGVTGAFVSTGFYDLDLAWTLTDLNGHFTLCDVAGSYLSVAKEGYQSSDAVMAKDGMTVQLKRK